MAQSDDKRSNRSVAMVISALVLLPIVYVLSIGPVAELVIQGQFAAEVYQMLYAPIFWAVEKSASLEGLLQWYFKLFEDSVVSARGS